MIRPGDAAPDFTLPAVLTPDDVSLADRLRGGAVLLGLFRGLHCRFCRRQIAQFSALHEPLARLGVSILVVVNTPRDRAALYFRPRSPRVTLLADATADTHRLFGVPCVVLDEAFAAVRINPTGELPAPLHPIEANRALNDRDHFVTTAVDEEVFARHGTQLAAHYLIDQDGVVRWASMRPSRASTRSPASRARARSSPQSGHPVSRARGRPRRRVRSPPRSSRTRGIWRTRWPPTPCARSSFRAAQPARRATSAVINSASAVT